ncbi:hypothetical protein CI109_103981 [Kwoniella shandongensis]|uniref:Uncharacterized protein n=1 Tax=Kwoniella shandongensis TaxID=1734106 RepID=A0A5M6BXL2_9TREE|nr:uncharacterized protein CI109_004135 [Kwoniella shandongensis]KAA5527596.1 hypothetical protein CI109_004135 [Kwoniella shandongensis]
MTLTLLACGSNSASHLALNHNQDVSRLTPTIFHPSTSIPSTSQIIDLVSTSAHSLLLLSPGSDSDGGKDILLGAGMNTFGQLGPRCALWDDVKPEGRWKEVDLVGDLGLEGDWEPIKIASTWSTTFVVHQRSVPPAVAQQDVGGGSSASGGLNSTERKEDDQPEQIVLSCGSNDFGELGGAAPLILNAPSPIPISRPSQRPTIVDLGLQKGDTVEMIKGGQRHVVVVISGPNGQRVMGWGASRKGELDATSCGAAPGSGTSAKGKCKGKGKSTAYPPTSPPTTINLVVPEGERIVDIALGASHTLVFLSSGQVIGWGSNMKGQLTDIDQLDNVIGISATWGGSYFLTSTGNILSQGSNTHSQLMRSSTTESRGQITVPEGWKGKRIVAGSEHLLVLATKNGEEGLWAGGWNEHGNLGLGDEKDRSSLERVDIPSGGKIKGLWGGCASTWVWVE